MLKFNRPNVVPPSRDYFFALPSGEVVRRPSRTALENLVRSELVKQGEPVPEDLRAEIEHYMCQYLPETFCVGEGDRVRKVYSSSQLREWSRKRAAKYERTTPGLADERANVCAGCPMNDRTMCSSCTGLSAYARSLAGRPQFREFGFLGVCACDAAVLGLEVCLDDTPGLTGGEVPENCWRKQND